MQGEEQLQSLYQMMEEEISAHRALLDEVKREADCLRKGSTETLMHVVHCIDEQRAFILRKKQEIGRAVETLHLAFGKDLAEKDLSALIPMLPVPAQQRVKGYEKNLARVKEWIRRNNDRNKAFIQEALSCWQNLFSILVQPLAEAPEYARNGQKKRVPEPYALNRKV